MPVGIVLGVLGLASGVMAREDAKDAAREERRMREKQLKLAAQAKKEGQQVLNNPHTSYGGERAPEQVTGQARPATPRNDRSQVQNAYVSAPTRTRPSPMQPSNNLLGTQAPPQLYQTQIQGMPASQVQLPRRV